MGKSASGQDMAITFNNTQQLQFSAHDSALGYSIRDQGGTLEAPLFPKEGVDGC